MNRKSRVSFRVTNMVLSAKLVALLAIFSYTSISLPSGVPITLQTMAVFLVGALLSPLYAFATVSIWVMIGALGLPVFAKGASGFGVLGDYTGGYIFSFIIAAVFISLFKGKNNSFIRYIIVMTLATFLIIYPIGGYRAAMIFGLDFKQSIDKLIVPFLPGAVVKISLGAYIAKSVVAGINPVNNIKPIQTSKELA